MAQKISDFTTKSTGLTADAFIPMIDVNPKKGNTYENYKLNVIEYFYSKSEIDELIKNLNTVVNNKFSQEINNNTNLKNEIIEYIEDLETIIQRKQDSNLGDAGYVVITNDSWNIDLSEITVQELNSLKNIQGNIEERLRALQLQVDNIDGRMKSLENLEARIAKLENRAVTAPVFGSNYKISLSVSAVYKINSDGWILAWAKQEGGAMDYNLVVNGVTVFQGDPHGHHSSSDSWLLVPVKPEDSVQFTASQGYSKLYYFPCETKYTAPTKL